jgi:hypothetical protein
MIYNFTVFMGVRLGLLTQGGAQIEIENRMLEGIFEYNRGGGGGE